MTWLQRRLDTLGYTHRDLAQALAERGIERVRGTISGWARGSITVSILANPKTATALADALDWSVSEMLIAAGYPLDALPADVPAEIYPLLEAMQPLTSDERRLVVEVLLYGSELIHHFKDAPDDA